jgi:hypothetical protein
MISDYFFLQKLKEKLNPESASYNTEESKLALFNVIRIVFG